MIGSHLSGWDANEAMLFVSSERSVCSSNVTSWTHLGNPAIGKGAENTFASQPTFVLPWNDTMMVAMLDKCKRDYRIYGLASSDKEPGWHMDYAVVRRVG